MLVDVIKLGFLGLNTKSRDEMVSHYGRVIGLPIAGSDGGTTYFSCGNDSYSISLHEGGTRGYRHVGLCVAGTEPLSDVQAALKAEGVASAIKSDLFPGIPSCLEIADPDGHTVYLYRDAANSQRYGDVGVAPRKLGHVALFVRDPQVAADYYTRVLGFRWSDWMEDFFVFMRCGADHHSMNFIRLGERRGLFHVAFELRDWNHVGHACETLGKHEVKLIWGPGRHGPGHNIFTYHRDPDDNIVELYADMDLMSNEALGHFDPRPHHSDVPCKPKVWKRSWQAGNAWGIDAPPEFYR